MWKSKSTFPKCPICQYQPTHPRSINCHLTSLLTSLSSTLHYFFSLIIVPHLTWPSIFIALDFFENSLKFWIQITEQNPVDSFLRCWWNRSKFWKEKQNMNTNKNREYEHTKTKTINTFLQIHYWHHLAPHISPHYTSKYKIYLPVDSGGFC